MAFKSVNYDRFNSVKVSNPSQPSPGGLATLWLSLCKLQKKAELN